MKHPSPERETLSPALREQFDRLNDYAYKATMLGQLTADPALKNALRNFTTAFIEGRRALVLAYAEGRQAGEEKERERVEGVFWAYVHSNLQGARMRTVLGEILDRIRATSQDPQEPPR